MPELAGFADGNTAMAESCRWNVDELALDDISHEWLEGDEAIFHIVVTASFVEISSDLYTRNLVESFRAHVGVAHWLQQSWEPEELQHGRALRAYIRKAWPGFDWNAAYADFIAEYALLCRPEALEKSPALEMAARCIIEMGTSTYYRALQDYADEPVLRQLAGLIRQDEVRHYKNFYRFFRQCNMAERNGRLRVFGALRRRLWELRNSDAECAFWHAFNHRHPGFHRGGPEFRAAFSDVARLIRQHYPGRMAVKMTLKPLDLPARLQKTIAQPLALATQRWLLR